jgi:hypothetical protein
MDRLQLQSLLETYTDNVYFQPPDGLAILRPCIVYARDAGSTDFADNKVWSFTQRYQVTAIDRNPDSDIQAKLAMTPQCLFVRHYAKDGLNHDVFTLYW